MKAILVIDVPEEYIDENLSLNGLLVNQKDGDIRYISNTFDVSLRFFPEKQKITGNETYINGIGEEMFDKGYVSGWNTCIDHFRGKI